MGDWIMLRSLRNALGWSLLLAMPAAAQPGDARFLISPVSVAQALVAAGVPVAATQVKFLSDVSATGRNPVLKVINVATWTDGSYKAELRCHDHSACLPFYVLLTGSQTAEAHGRGSTESQPSSGTLPALPVKQALMRDGDRATLVFENSSLRISMPVICLQSGERGQTIRVVSADHKRFFKAQIVESGLLRATL